MERGLHATIFLGTRPAAVIVNPVPINALGEGASMIHIVILIQLGLPTCSSLIEALHRPGHQHIIGTSGGGHLQEELVTGSDALYSYRNWRVTSLGTGGIRELPVWEQEELDYPIVVRTGGRSSAETLPTVPI